MKRQHIGRNLVITLFCLLIVSLFSGSGSYAEDSDEGYRGARWGMSEPEVRRVIQGLGLEYVDYEKLRVRDRIFGADAEIKYLVGQNLPLEMVMVEVKRPSGAQVSYERIKSALVQKYGKPLKKRAGHEKDRLEMWATSGTGIWLMVDDDGAFALIIYSDINAEKKYY